MINPNQMTAITDRLVMSARSVCAPDTEIVATTAHDGPLSVESYTEEALGAVAVAKAVAARTDVDAHVVACFGDTGVNAAREVSDVPVVGMTEAAYAAALLIASRFVVVTLPPRTRAHAERVLREMGCEHRASVRAIDVHVTSLEDEEAAAMPLIEAEARAAILEGAEALVLGCAGMAGLVEPLRQRLGVPVIDGTAVALGMAETLVRNGLRAADRGTFAVPAAVARGELS